MSSVRRRRDRVVIRLAEHEVAVLTSVLTQYAGLIADDDEDDPAIARLYPDGYRDDPEASAEFRRYTRDALRDRKAAAAAAIGEAVASGSPIELTVDDAARWLPALTDLRLVLAERLGIHDENDSPTGALADVYHWLGELQWFLVHAIDEGAG